MDNLVAYFAPTWAVQRVQARAALKIMNTQRGGVSTRLSDPWVTTRSIVGGTSLQRSDALSMCDRARKAYGTNPIAKSLLETETDYVVGDGMTFQSTTGQKEYDREVEQRFPEWLDSADYRGVMSRSELFRVSWREPRKDGDGGFILVADGIDSRLQYIPRDRIQGPHGIGETLKLQDGSVIQDGVESDAAGKPRGFWMLDEDEIGKRKFTRVDASNFVYLTNLNGPLEIRGTSVYSTIFELLDQISGYVDAVVIAARMAAIFGLIFKGTSSPTELSQLTTLTNSQGDLQKAMTLESGSLRLVGSKDEVVQVQAQQPMQNTPDFIRAMFRLICLPFGLPIELGMKDVSQVTFISGRLGLRDAERNFRAKQCYLRSRCWYRIFEWWIARERKKQQAGVSDFVTQIPAEAYLYNFSAPAFPIADELNQNQSDLLAIDMGIKSPQCVAAERGMDWSELQDDLETAQTTRDEKDLPELHSTLTRNPAPEPVAVPPQPPTQPDQIKAYARAFRDLLSSNGDLE